MEKIGVIYTLFGETEYPKLKETLSGFHNRLAAAKNNIYYEGAAICRENFHFEGFRQAAGWAFAAKEDMNGDCALENLALTWLALKNSMDRGEFDKWQVIFLTADPDRWDEELIRCAGYFRNLPGTLECYFAYPDGRDGGGELEQFMKDLGKYRGNARHLL